MRKILSSLMILILLALFGATYVSSIKTEEVFKSQIEQLNQNYAGLLQVKLLDYRRGFLVSEVNTEVKLRQDSLPLHHQIRHFPWKVRMLTNVAETSDAMAELAKRLPVEQFQLQTDVSLNGSSQSSFALAKLSFADQQTEFQLQGLSCEFDLESEIRGGQLQFHLDGLQVSEPGVAELTLADLQIDSRFTETQGLPVGGGTVRIGEFSLTQSETAVIALNELLYQVDSELENEQFSSAIDLRMQRLQLGGESFTDGKLLLQFTGIDAATVRELQTNIRQLQTELHGEKVDPLILQLQLLGLYTQLFQKGVTISLPQLSLLADDGALTGAGEVQLQQLNLAGGGMAFDNIEGKLRLVVELPIFQAGFRVYSILKDSGRSDNKAVLNEQAEQLAEALIQKGIFSRGEDGYVVDFSLKQGQAELNGQRFRLQF